MATGDSSGQGKERMDLVIGRPRYGNALPPPPIPPKLLDIPHPGMKKYLTPDFGSGLFDKQPVDIEPDGDLGMPLNLIGFPGVFDGDMSCTSTAGQHLLRSN